MPPSTTTPIAPGSWLGLLGGGQLGRMFCMAAQSLGYKVCVLDPGRDSPAGAVADVEAARARLAERDVEFLGETVDTGVCHVAFFCDPDGNVLILHRRYAPPGER